MDFAPSRNINPLDRPAGWRGQVCVGDLAQESQLQFLLAFAGELGNPKAIFSSFLHVVGFVVDDNFYGATCYAHIWIHPNPMSLHNCFIMRPFPLFFFFVKATISSINRLLCLDQISPRLLWKAYINRHRLIMHMHVRCWSLQTVCIDYKLWWEERSRYCNLLNIYHLYLLFTVYYIRFPPIYILSIQQ